MLLTSKQPKPVANAYRQALTGATPFTCDAERRQLELYQRLGILKENVQSALSAFPEPSNPVAPTARKRVLLFAGHRLDSPNRVPVRFPQEKEEVARQAIRDAIKAEREITGEIAYGIAGGSHGGDLLFHEVCAELGIQTKLWMALPPNEYVKVAVQDYVGIGTDKLYKRFNQLQQRCANRCMSNNNNLPRWLQTKANYSFWQRHTLWMIYNALAEGDGNLTLIALWNGDNDNATGDFVHRVKDLGAEVVPIFTKQLFGL